MISEQARSGFWLDPRTKIILLLLCVLSAAMAPSLFYEFFLVMLIGVYGIVCKKTSYSLFSAGLYIGFYLLTLSALQLDELLQAMLIAFLGLIHKIYPCGMMAGIIISTTKAGEFLSAMNRSHVSRKISIPIAVMLRYIPTIREDWHFIKDAMEMRDISPSLKNFLLHPAMTIECIYVPLMMAASKTADELTIACVTRGIENPKPRTSFVQIGFGAADGIAVLLFLAMFLLGQWGKEVFL